MWVLVLFVFCLILAFVAAVALKLFVFALHLVAIGGMMIILGAILWVGVWACSQGRDYERE